VMWAPFGRAEVIREDSEQDGDDRTIGPKTSTKILQWWALNRTRRCAHSVREKRTICGCGLLGDLPKLGMKTCTLCTAIHEI
jgi:hypothetical protein